MTGVQTCALPICIIVRFIGLLYKIPMTRAIGDEGIGYYNTAYEIYNIGLILSS